MRRRFGKSSASPDPGVLEINLPPCPTWREYAHWMKTVGTDDKGAGLALVQAPSREDEPVLEVAITFSLAVRASDENPLFTLRAGHLDLVTGSIILRSRILSPASMSVVVAGRPRRMSA